MTRGPGQRTERKDGQVRREYGMNQMDGEDEEETDDEIFFLFISILSYMVSVPITLIYFLFFIFIFECPIHFAPRVIREGESVRGRNTLTYIQPLQPQSPFGSIVYYYLSPKTLTFNHHYVHNLCYSTIERGSVYLWEQRS